MVVRGQNFETVESDSESSEHSDYGTSFEYQVFFISKAF